MTSATLHRRVDTQNQEIGIHANYRIVRASEELTARMLEWYLRRGMPFEWYLKQVKKPDERMRAHITEAVRTAPAHLLADANISYQHNLVPSVLRNSFATLISGTSVTPTFKANYMALGSSSTAAANSDTQLGTETVRATFSSRSATLNVASLDAFFDVSQVAGNSYSEAGVFVDGTASANSGYLLSRVIINETMGSNETLTINVTFTIS